MPQDAPTSESSDGATPSGALVVVVHGMGRTHVSMTPVTVALRRSGYRVLNVFYSSYGPDISQIGATLREKLDAELSARPAREVHFVGHSLGNIVIRWLLEHRRPEGVGRVVMLAPPNQGSRSADRLAAKVGWLLRPIVELQTTGGTAVDLPPPPADIQVAVIAGARDGKVSVEEAALPGAEAHLVVDASHTFIMMNRQVIGAIQRFLATGAMES